MRFKDVLNQYATEGNIEMLSTTISMIKKNELEDDDRHKLLVGALFYAAKNDRLEAVKLLLGADTLSAEFAKICDDKKAGTAVSAYYSVLRSNVALHKDVGEQGKILNTLAIIGGTISALGAAICLTSAFLIGAPLLLTGTAIMFVGLVKAVVCLGILHHNACRVAESDASLARA